MEDQEFIDAVKNHPKIFTGYSDTTNNHIMLNKLGLSTFYGPCFITDIAEVDLDMIPYTKSFFEKFMTDGEPFEIKSSEYWYNDRESFDFVEGSNPRITHKEEHGFETLNGSGIRTGKLYGGCIESIYDAYTGDAETVFKKYNLLPTKDEWKDKILFLEPSEERMLPTKLEEILTFMKDQDILTSVQGVIIGKPYNEVYYNEYKEIIKKVFNGIDTPVLYNLNFGHSFPRCILPYDAEATIDYDNRRVYVTSNFLSNERDLENKEEMKLKR